MPMMLNDGKWCYGGKKQGLVRVGLWGCHQEQAAQKQHLQSDLTQEGSHVDFWENWGTNSQCKVEVGQGV